MENRYKGEIDSIVKQYIDDYFKNLESVTTEKYNNLTNDITIVNDSYRKTFDTIFSSMIVRNSSTREELMSYVMMISIAALGISDTIDEYNNDFRASKENALVTISAMIKQISTISPDYELLFNKLHDYEFTTRYTGIIKLRDYKKLQEYSTTIFDTQVEIKKSIIIDILNKVYDNINSMSGKMLVDEVMEKSDNLFTKVMINIIDDSRRFNIANDSIFETMVERVNKIVKNKIEISVEIPTFDYDLLYSQFLNAVENDDDEAIQTIAVTIFPDMFEVFLEMTPVQIKTYIENNYFYT